MSNSSWIEQLGLKRLKAAQTKAQNNSQPLRVALVGVGSELNGDDAAGIQVARRLAEAAGKPADFLALDGGSIPENASGPLRRFRPDLVFVVDAADLNTAPGAICWLEEKEIDGMSASSHTLPLTILGGYLSQELSCQVCYLGIQPKSLDFAEELSREAAAAVDEVVKGFVSVFF